MIVFPKLRSKEHLLNKTIHKSNKNLYTYFPTKFCFYTDFFFLLNQLDDCNQTSLNLYMLIPPNALIQTNTYMWERDYHLQKDSWNLWKLCGVTTYFYLYKKKLKINNFCIALKVTFTIDRKLQGFGLNYILPKWKLHDKTLI